MKLTDLSMNDRIVDIYRIMVVSFSIGNPRDVGSDFRIFLKKESAYSQRSVIVETDLVGRYNKKDEVMMGGNMLNDDKDARFHSVIMVKGLFDVMEKEK